MPPSTKSIVLKPRFVIPVSRALFISAKPSMYAASLSVLGVGIHAFSICGATSADKTGKFSLNSLSVPVNEFLMSLPIAPMSIKGICICLWNDL